MEAGPRHERSKDHVDENEDYSVFGERVLPPVCTAQAARGVRFAGP